MKRRATKKRGARGFTLIEVLTSMGVMVVGVMAIVGLQQHTVIINSEARQMAIANQIAQTWIERFKQDASTWTETGEPLGPITPAQVIANTLWLSAVNGAPNVWQTLPNATATTSNSFDFRGNEIQPVVGGIAAAPPHFCVGFRPAWVYPGHALRVDVRVYWPRGRPGVSLPNCTELGIALNPGGPSYTAFHTMYLSTVIKNTLVVR